MFKAIRVAEGAFRAVMGRIRLGMTERALAADLQHEMLRRGASEASFPIIVAEGRNSSLPHATPGDRKIRVVQELTRTDQTEPPDTGKDQETEPVEV